MPHNIGCFIKWFYLILILQALCLRCLECRQQQNKHKNGNNNNNNNNNNNHNRQQSSYSNEQQNSDLYDSIENDSSSNSGVFNSHGHGYSHVNGHGHGHGNRRGSGGGGGGGGGGGARKKHHNNRNNNHNRQMDDNDLSLWINEQQLKILSELFFPPGYTGRIYAIENGHVLNDIRDMSIYKFLVIPSEVNYVNFTWKSGTRKYSYHFDRLQTLDDSILKAPTLSIKTKGRIPQDEKNFSIFLPCSGNNSGTAMFNVGLSIENRRGKPLPGTPIRLNFKKECAHRGVYDSLDASNPTSLTTSQGPDPECNLKCGNNGFCNGHKICQCKVGYTGQYCQTAFCFPQCMNGGNCTAPSVCTCPDGYQGTQCEGGICTEKCLNGGKCVQKDKCQCSKGYYGLRCEYSKCVIPCKNGGRCIGNNVCRCPEGLRGNHCEIGRRERSACKCKNGICLPNRKCKCDPGFYGRRCHRRNKRHPQITSYR